MPIDKDTSGNSISAKSRSSECQIPIIRGVLCPQRVLKRFRDLCLAPCCRPPWDASFCRMLSRNWTNAWITTGRGFLAELHTGDRQSLQGRECIAAHGALVQSRQVDRAPTEPLPNPRRVPGKPACTTCLWARSLRRYCRCRSPAAGIPRSACARRLAL
jgi:hypothetical protein